MHFIFYSYLCTRNKGTSCADIGIWCNGNTTDSGPVILGSSPSIPTADIQSEASVFLFNLIGIWCNGNTTDSGPVILGSSPSIPTYKKVQQIIVAPFCVIRHFILIDYVYATVYNKCRSNQ